MADVFLSYVGEDEDVAVAIAGGLEAAGYSAFLWLVFWR
jgi:hypothetical protein